MIPLGGREEIVAAFIQHSAVWPFLERLALTKNMCLLETTPEILLFEKWPTEMSHDPSQIGRNPIPPMVWRSVDFQKFVVERIYPAAELQQSLTNPDFFNGRAILSPTNEAVVKINDSLLGQLPGEELTFHGEDSGDINDASHEEMTKEAMATMDCGGLSLSVLRLKTGAPVMLLRNLDPIYGLCNGTGMTLLRASTRCLEVRLNGGSFNGQKRLIYRTKLTSNETDFFLNFHFKLTRFQLPVRLAFAMTKQITRLVSDPRRH